MTASLVHRNCPICGRDDAKPWLAKAGLVLVRCNACGMVYVPTVGAGFVTGEYYDDAGSEYYLSPAKLESDYADVRFERELRRFRKHSPGGSVLDVGCSSGAFLFQLNRRFPGEYQILGTDMSGAPLDYAESRGVPVLRGNFLEQDFAGRKFDAITFWAVLEHLGEPRRFLEQAADLLKPGGLCIVLVPNLESLATRLLGARYRYIYPQHLNYFTQASLRRLASGLFELVESSTTHFNPVVIWQDWRRAGVEVSNASRAELLKQTTALKQNPLMTPVKQAYRLAESLLGKVGLADNILFVLRRKA
jgi:2-polyprenyl-3-methyl-5-hydroxy-6-metoxy-1,4-benzoquinol methylase